MDKKQKNFKLTKKRIIVLIIAAILIISILFGISKLFKNIFGKEKVYGNLSNKGYVVGDGSTVYYYKYDKGIVKVKGGKEYQITEDTAYCMTIYDGKIYYLTVSNQNTIDLACVETNGEGNKKIKTLNTLIDKFFIEDNYVYYARRENNTSGISKFSLDNVAEDNIISASNVKDFVLEKGTIYYSDSIGYLHSVGTNGDNNKLISDKYNISRFQIMGKWIYFYENNESNSNESALFKIKKDGSAKTKVSTFVKNEIFNVTSKCIYYFDKANGKICKCDLKGEKSNDIVTISTGTTKINVINGVMYYLDKSKSDTSIYQIFRVKTNGKAAKEIVY